MPVLAANCPWILPNNPCILLLLLHLLQVQPHRPLLRLLLLPFHQHAPIMWNQQLAVQRRSALTAFNLHNHIEFTLSIPSKNPMRRRNVRVIPSNRSSNMPMMGYQIIRWIKTNPPQMRQKHIHPGVGCIRCRPVMVFSAAIKIPRNRGTSSSMTVAYARSR